MKTKKTVIDKIREDNTEITRYRRLIAAQSALGLIDFSLISLFQLGFIKSMPDLPGKVFDTEKVNSSQDAVLLGMPDGFVSLGAYTATMLLATAATRFKKQSRILDVAMGAVILGQAAGAAQYLYKMAFVQKKVCIYCVAGAVINFSSLSPMLKILKRRD
ncbi:vitamin K epoxide reductase family protein [Pontibacter toksunensis]|uniref:Vitamin K epoxide reductase family protein n=1 Tax=Pontibacter toksunensis TaxID=1332631 RepID=A0ABW6BQM1_9BACT